MPSPFLLTFAVASKLNYPCLLGPEVEVDQVDPNDAPALGSPSSGVAAIFREDSEDGAMSDKSSSPSLKPRAGAPLEFPDGRVGPLAVSDSDDGGPGGPDPPDRPDPDEARVIDEALGALREGGENFDLDAAMKESLELEVKKELGDLRTAPSPS